MTGDALTLFIAAVGVVAAVVIGAFFYWLAKKERRPVYLVAGNTVVRADENQHIQILYKGEHVPVVTRTVVVFWNAGREPIRRDDLVRTHPLHVKLPAEAWVLDTEVIAATRSQIDFNYLSGLPRNELGLDFSHLNRRDGAAVELLHTGADPFDVKVEGAIVGVTGDPKLMYDSDWDRLLLRRKYARFALPATGIMTLGFLLPPNGSLLAALILAVGMVASATYLTVTYWQMELYQVPKPLRWTLGPPELRADRRIANVEGMA